jgi:hypothetical protein
LRRDKPVAQRGQEVGVPDIPNLERKQGKGASR